MTDWLRSLKPAAPARVHLLAASLMWTVVGGGMLYFGSHWVLGGRIPYVRLLLAVAVGVGLFKSHFVLDRVARRTVERIRTRGDGRCIGGFLSWRTWAFVVLMMAAGRLMRGGLLPKPEVGLVYTAVGTALLLSARLLWLAWWRHSGTPEP
jgi:hypothetical protein